jgi:hypothetical protein
MYSIFFKTRYLNVEVNRTEHSTSISVPGSVDIIARVGVKWRGSYEYRGGFVEALSPT